MLRRVRRGVETAATSLGLVAAMLLSSLGARPIWAQRVDEYRVKAAVLYNLTKFVEWPAEAFPHVSTPLTICVLGVDPFGSVLDESLEGRMVSGRAVVARRVTDVDAGCHVLFVADSEARRLDTIIDSLRTASVLTVGELSDFIEHGGMIGLLTDDNRVTFDINVSAAEHARLKISARVMTLAASVRRTGGPGR